MNDENQKISEWIDRIKLNGKVESDIEKMRFSILEDIHHRIDKDEKENHFLWKRLLVAASLSLIIALSTWLVYQFDFLKSDMGMQYFVCPLGVKSTVTLPDGTTILLNGGTTFAYNPSTFGNKDRQVVLNGEAFFDVGRNENVPFIVKSGVAEIKVLGTRFNVESYQSDEYVKVTLESGKVSMKIAETDDKCILFPGQQAVYDKKDNQLIRHTVNVKETIAWCDGEIVFSDAPLEEIVKKLERHFNVNIAIQSETLKKSRYNGTFTADDNLERILSFLSTMDHRLHYKVENKNIYIYEISSE